MAQRSIIKAENAFKEILRFEPQKLVTSNPEAIDDFIKSSDNNPDFQVAEVVRNFTGLAEIEEERMESEIQKKALLELKSIQEQAYSEAFEIGIAEGRRQAFVETSEQIETKLDELDKLLNSIRSSKIHFLNSNEHHLVKMVYFLSTKLALFEVSERSQEAILSVLRSAVSASHGDETVRVSVSPDQIDFLEVLQKEKSRDLDFLKNVELTPQEGIRPGGCIITTNYSEVDARIEERINKLWEEIKGAIPPIKEVMTNE
ncbi:MAG: hypothetical protein RJB66_831 [Pseudomonadota bacterium]|jgi:flagellar assembly protein FliH